MTFEIKMCPGQSSIPTVAHSPRKAASSSGRFHSWNSDMSNIFTCHRQHLRLLVSRSCNNKLFSFRENCSESISPHWIELMLLVAEHRRRAAHYMPTVPFQYVWLRAAVWLSELAVTPFTFSTWDKLRISFGLRGIFIDLWHVQERLIVSSCYLLVPTSSEWLIRMKRDGGEPAQTFISAIIWSEIESRGDPSVSESVTPPVTAVV